MSQTVCVCVRLCLWRDFVCVRPCACVWRDFVCVRLCVCVERDFVCVRLCVCVSANCVLRLCESDRVCVCQFRVVPRAGRTHTYGMCPSACSWPHTTQQDILTTQLNKTNFRHGTCFCGFPPKEGGSGCIGTALASAGEC